MNDLVNLWKVIKKENPNCITLNSFIVYSFVIDFSIENVFLPVFICGKKVQFTNVCFTCNSSGNDYFLVLINNKFFFLEYAYEPDCDGAYYTHYIVNIFDVRENYTVSEVYTNCILKMLQSY